MPFDSGMIRGLDLNSKEQSIIEFDGADQDICGQKRKHIHMTCLRPLLTTNG